MFFRGSKEEMMNRLVIILCVVAMIPGAMSAQPANADFGSACAHFKQHQILGWYCKEWAEGWRLGITRQDLFAVLMETHKDLVDKMGTVEARAKMAADKVNRLEGHVASLPTVAPISGPSGVSEDGVRIIAQEAVKVELGSVQSKLTMLEGDMDGVKKLVTETRTWGPGADLGPIESRVDATVMEVNSLRRRQWLPVASVVFALAGAVFSAAQ